MCLRPTITIGLRLYGKMVHPVSYGQVEAKKKYELSRPRHEGAAAVRRALESEDPNEAELRAGVDKLMSFCVMYKIHVEEKDQVRDQQIETYRAHLHSYDCCTGSHGGNEIWLPIILDMPTLRGTP
jgi:hypothetical protein